MALLADRIDSFGGPEAPVEASRRQFFLDTYGGAVDGVTEDDDAILRAVDEAYDAGGGEVTIPHGRSVMTSDSLRIVLPAGVRLCGERRGIPGIVALAPLEFDGAALLVTNPDDDFITFDGANASVSDLLLHWPDQVLPTVATPIEFPWAIKNTGGDNTNCQIERVLMTNAYNGISLASGEHTLEGLRLGCLSTAVKLDANYNTVTGNNILVIGYYSKGYGVNTNLDIWSLTNGIAFDVGQTGMNFSNILVYQKKIGFWFNGTGAGNISNCDLDTVQIAIQADESDTNIGYGFTNLQAGGNVGDVGNVSTYAIHQSAASLIRVNGGAFWNWPTPISPPHASGIIDIRGVTGASGLGPVSSPSVPASAVTLRNPYPFPCLVILNGGTVTGLEVNGGGWPDTAPVIVGPGQTIAATYSAAPTWSWIGL